MTVLSKLESAPRAIRPEHVLQYLVGIITLVILTLALRIVYRVVFHPLKKFPGPKLAAASNIPYLYYTSIGQNVSWICKLHEKYGEVVRYGPETLSYISPQAWKDIHGHRLGGHEELKKDLQRFYTPEINGEHGIVTEPSAQEHGRVRRIFSNAFSDKALKLQEPIIQKHINKLKRNINQALAQSTDVELDAVKLYNCTTFDVMGDLTFGEPLGMLDTGEYTPWVQAIFQNIKAATYLRVALFYPMLQIPLKLLMPPSLRGKQAEHFLHSVERVDKRLEKGMHANASAFMIAGTETTATLLSGMTYYLLTNPDKLKKLVDEVRALPEEDLTLDVLPRLKYLNACFEEALRCYPPVPIGIPRIVPKGGASICGELVPEGSVVMVSQKAAYQSPLNFKDADKFIPERWLPDTGYDSDRKVVLQPFSFGPRNCIGKKYVLYNPQNAVYILKQVCSLAYHEMRVIAAMVLWNFDLELCPESKDWAKQDTYALWEKGPLMVKFKPAQH
ncbi:cytochrome p450 [Pyrenophora tritici-repentis]|nr:cytochrome p450 [Pyrenophora tritici-repentis]